MTAGLCTLELAVGRREECPGHRCPFWDSAGVTACAVDRIRDRVVEAPALAGHLLELRDTLFRARRVGEHDAARAALVAATGGSVIPRNCDQRLR